MVLTEKKSFSYEQRQWHLVTARNATFKDVSLANLSNSVENESCVLRVEDKLLGRMKSRKRSKSNTFLQKFFNIVDARGS